MRKTISSILMAASAAFIFPLSIVPDAEVKCADPSWEFRTEKGTDAQVAAAREAKDGFCKTVDRYIELYL